MVGEVARNKALAILLGKAKVVDTDGKTVDLKEFAAVVSEPEDVVDGHEGHDHGDHEGHSH
jgi:trigger factor